MSSTRYWEQKSSRASERPAIQLAGNRVSDRAGGALIACGANGYGSATVGGAGARRAVARFAKPVKISAAPTELVEADTAAFLASFVSFHSWRTGERILELKRQWDGGFSSVACSSPLSCKHSCQDSLPRREGMTNHGHCPNIEHLMAQRNVLILIVCKAAGYSASRMCTWPSIMQCLYVHVTVDICVKNFGNCLQND